MNLPVETLNNVALLPEKERLAFAKVLGKHVAELITTDLHKLLQLLYRIDVDEQKLQRLLGNNPPHNAALLIAELMIERQLQKSAYKQTQPPHKDI
ncbi:MAG: hypothetical protein WKF70_06115 [Chitinophagaceae bacterium]